MLRDRILKNITQENNKKKIPKTKALASNFIFLILMIFKSF